MKNTIIYIGLYTAAFVFVTLAIILLNERYTNIFDFNFTEIKDTQVNEANMDIAAFDFNQLKEYLDTQFKKDLLDSLKSAKVVSDTVVKEVVQDGLLLDSLEFLRSKLTLVSDSLTEKKTILQEMDTVKVPQINVVWAKKTGKLFESMNPRNAAKIIQKYSDNEASEIIYSMNKKKAAAILSQLDPNYAKRITKPEL